MPNLVNTIVTSEYKRIFESAEGMLVASITGLSVSESESIRGDLDKGGARMHMLRNVLARRMLAEQGYEFPADAFVGNMAVVFGNTEATIHAAKVLTATEVKKLEKVVIRGGVLDSTQLSAADAVLLAGIPDKLSLRAQMLGVLQGPARGLASLLNALPSGMARVMQAHIDSQSGSEEETAQAS